jgi:glycosyltransferase involved in cell wall biosynthesis
MRLASVMTSKRTKPKVCIVGGACTEGDAISAAIAADCKALAESDAYDPFVLTGRTEIDVPGAEVRGLRGLLYHRRFVDADIRLFHFGFYSELMDACVLGRGRVKRIVRYHNITPPEFVAPSQRANIEKGHRQVAAVASADEVWPISRYNGLSLAEMGIRVDLDKTLSMPVMPLTRRGDPRQKGGPITIAFVGRIVPAKGVHILLDAFELLLKRGFDDVDLVVIGSTYIRDYASQIRKRISSLKRAHFLGKVSQARLARAYEQASIIAIPSYHEGLCVPVIEALHAGAIPVVTDAAALPETLNGLGRLCPTGDPVSLADRLAEVVADIRAIRRDPHHARLRVQRGAMLADDYQDAVARHLTAYAPATLGRELTRRLGCIV